MEVRRTNIYDFEDICTFNQRIYPEKKVNQEEYIKFWFSKDKDACNTSIICRDDEGNIVGQNLYSSMQYFYKGNLFKSFWNFDLIIEEKYRKGGWGADILMKGKEFYPSIFATGSNDNALKMNLKLGHKLLGTLRKYIGITNPVYVLSSLARGYVPVEKFPSEIQSNEVKFIKVEKSDLPFFSLPFNDGLWEPARDNDYLSWRYFNNLHQYAFYKSTSNSDYFVLRTICISHITMMLLVDYRCNVDVSHPFEIIYKAVVKVMNKVNLGVLLASSSLSTIDEVLESHHFKSIGRPRPIVGLIKIKDRQQDIDARNFAFVTYADSDGETNWL